MTAKEILAELPKLGSEAIKKVLLKHGAKEPFYGVKVETLKKIQKQAKIKKDYAISMELYASGISDAMYLAGLIADETKMTKQDLQQWVDKAHWSMISEYAVPWVAAESRYGQELAEEWINSDKELIASAGWSTLANILSLKPDDELNKDVVKTLLDRAEREIKTAPNRVCYTMNNFVIAVGAYVPSLSNYAVTVGKRIGAVSIDMGGTACKVPFSPDYIEKIKQRGGGIGKKKKTVRC